MTHAGIALCGDASSPVPAMLLAEVLPAGLLRQLQADATHIAEAPNYWFPRNEIEAGNCKTVGEEVICHLFKTCLQGRLPDTWGGAEWWVQIYQGGRGLAFHFDKDEHAMMVARKMVTPIFSSVLYLTDGGSASWQSPTVIVNQRFDQDGGYAYPDNPDHSTLLFPAINHYCLFDGGLGHGVLDCGHGQMRATFLVNWWESQPQAIQRITEQDIAKFKLALPSQAQACGGLEIAVAGCALEQGHGVAAAVPLPSLAVAERELGLEGCFMLDDLLLEQGLRITGEGAVRGVCIAHPGLVLFPVEQGQLQAAGERIQVGAVLVPLSSVPGGWDEEGESEGVATPEMSEGA